MASTLTNLIYHVVFSTKERRPFVDEDISERLYCYIRGIARSNNALVLEIGGVADHVHILLKLRASASLAHAVQVIKAGSSKWMREEIQQRTFAWQSGYAGFTVSESIVERVRAYIRRQKEHHLKHSFEDELRLLLEKHRVDYELEYLLG